MYGAEVHQQRAPATGQTSSENLLGESGTLDSFVGGEQGECTVLNGDEADDGESVEATLTLGDNDPCSPGGVGGAEARTEA